MRPELAAARSYPAAAIPLRRAITDVDDAVARMHVLVDDESDQRLEGKAWSAGCLPLVAATTQNCGSQHSPIGNSD